LSQTRQSWWFELKLLDQKVDLLTCQLAFNILWDLGRPSLGHVAVAKKGTNMYRLESDLLVIKHGEFFCEASSTLRCAIRPPYFVGRSEWRS